MTSFSAGKIGGARIGGARIGGARIGGEIELSPPVTAVNPP
jgi:hypothetical protein